MNRLLISRHVVFDESSFPFTSSDPPPNDLDSLFSSSPAVCPIGSPYPSSIAGTSEPVAMPHAAPVPQPATRAAPTPRPCHAQHRINASPSPPWCTSNDIRHPRRSPLAPGRRSTTPSPWLVTLAARTRWSLVVLPRSPSPWIVYNSLPPPLPRHCLQSRPLFVARSRTPTGVAL
jgi:hypothetical protein